MKKSIKFTIITVVLMLMTCAVLVAAYFKGTHTTEQTIFTEEADATFPTLIYQAGSQEVVASVGYAGARERDSLYPALVPLDVTRQLSVKISKSEAAVKSVQAVLYTMAGERIGDTASNYLTDEKDYESVTLDLSGFCSTDTEYLLEIQLHTTGKTSIYYYARVKAVRDSIFDEGVEFVREFIEKTFDKKKAQDLAIYMESAQGNTENSLRSLDIHASLDLLSWGGLSPGLCKEPQVSLWELEGDRAVFRADYQIAVQENEESNSYYTVEDYFQIRKSDIRIHLLEYERTMTQSFSSAEYAYSASGITLGIMEPEVEYAVSEDGKLSAWVQAGELWQYQKDTNEVRKVFSMQNVKQRGERQSFLQNYQIRILGQNEDGTLDFAVYGYFPKGAHEGETGILLAQYNPKQKGFEELLFAQSSASEEQVMAEAGRLLYRKDDRFYYYADGCIYCEQLQDGREKVIASGLEQGALAVSETQDCIAWEEQMDQAVTIQCMDLEEGTERSIHAADGEYIRAIGFVGKDFVYGRARSGQVLTTSAGSKWFLMYAVDIANPQGEVIKSYVDEAQLVTGGTANNTMIRLERVRVVGTEQFAAADAHQIVTSGEEAEQDIKTVTDSVKGEIVQLAVLRDRTAGMPKGDLTVRGNRSSLRILKARKKQTDGQEVYAVYRCGHLYGIHRQTKDAVVQAGRIQGTVRSTQGILFRRLRRPDQFKVTEERTVFPSEISGAGTNLAAEWQKAAGGTAFDATGMTLDDALSFAGQDIPVLTEYQSGSYAVLTGCDKSRTITMRDVRTGETSSCKMEDLEEMLAGQGNVFIVRIP